MGICPVAFGKVTGNLPLGVVLPNKISASALPPIVPGCQAYNTASDRFSSSLIINGRPAMITVMSGLFVPLNILISSDCAPCSFISAKQCASPDRMASSPIKAIMTSTWLAFANTLLKFILFLSLLYSRPFTK